MTRLPATATGHDRGRGMLELTGRLHGDAARPTALVLAREGAEDVVCPVRSGGGDGMDRDGSGFGVRLPLDVLAAGSAPGQGRWRAALLTDGVRVPLAAAPDLPPPPSPTPRATWWWT